jgi:hypothetical protein
VARDKILVVAQLLPETHPDVTVQSLWRPDRFYAYIATFTSGNKPVRSERLHPDNDLLDNGYKKQYSTSYGIQPKVV